MDHRITLHSVNFTFLSTHDPVLERLAALAERYVFDDPNTALIKIRQLAEMMAKGVAAHVGLPLEQDDKFSNVEKRLQERGLLDRSLREVMRMSQTRSQP